MSQNNTPETNNTIDTELEVLPTEEQIRADIEDGTPEYEPERLTVELIVQNLVSKIESDKITPYGIHTVINSTFKLLGSGKTVRPQMMYNYDRNGLLVKGKKGVKSYTKAEVTAYATKYVKKYWNTEN